jgi:aerobic carbon-monoxide dehydrogenase large subunit
MRTVNSFIGSPIERREDPRFLRGRGTYVDDLEREGTLHAAMLRSSVAHGRIRSIDASRALGLPGVHSVITAADLGGHVPNVPMRLQPLPEFESFAQPVIAHEKVRYVGEVLAVVLAESPALAEDALEAIEVDIELLPAVADRRASAKDQSILFEQKSTNLALKFRAVLGDAAAAFKDAPYVRRESFRVQRHMALPMEMRGLLAEWDAARGRLTVNGGAKVLFFNRRTLAKQMGLAEDAIDLVENDVGGGFGARGEFYPEDFLIPFAARLVGRPVKWIEDRREQLMSLNHAREQECDVEIACRRDGTILGLRGHAYSDVGAYMRTNGAISARNVAQFMSGPYRIPNIDIDVALQLTNKTPVGTYRGPGRFETDFFRERFFDMVAGDLGIDRIEFRRRNLVSKAEMPYSVATITPYEGKDEFDSGDYGVTLDRCLAEIGWADKADLHGKLIDGRYHGLGLACFVEGGAAGPKESARLVLETDGSVTVYVGSSSVGQGIETVFAQIAADALEIPMDQIRGVFHGSTSCVSDGYGAYHSRSVVMGGSAILSAASGLREAIRAQAAKRMGCTPGEVEIGDCKVTGPAGKSLSLARLADEPISFEGSFRNKKHTYAYGAHAAHVAVDLKLGHVEVLDYVAV